MDDSIGRTTIPLAVVTAAKHLIDEYGRNIVYIGKKDIWNVYVFQFPKGSLTGYPYVYLYDTEEHDVTTVTGFDALDIIKEFVK